MKTENYFYETPIRRAVHDALAHDINQHWGVIKETLNHRGFNPQKFEGRRKNFSMKYLALEKMLKFLFYTKLKYRYDQLDDMNMLPPSDRKKLNRFKNCHGVVYKNKEKALCGNRGCPFCHARMLYRMYGDLVPFLKPGFSMTSIFYRERVPVGRSSWGAGVLLSEKIISPLINKTSDLRVQYVRVPHWDFDWENKTVIVAMTLILIHPKDPMVLARIKQEIGRVQEPFDNPPVITEDATKENLCALIPKYFKFPVLMYVRDSVLGIEDYMRANSYFRYKAGVPNKRKNHSGIV
jgi:hypothetical protein